MRKANLGMVLAGGRVDELSVLTAARPKSAVSMWGMYRVIDFALSNMMHSGIDAVGVLSQYRPFSLNAHLAGGAPWDYVGRTRELKILSPYLGADDADWYRGTADALYQNLSYIRRYDPELVLVVSGDHVYSMDYRPVIRQHLATGADLTMVLKPVPREVAWQYGTAVLDADNRVVKYEEKAASPESNLASLTVYVFSAKALVERLERNVAEGRNVHIYSEVIPRMVAEGKRVYGYRFDGYWRYARTLDAYYQTNLDILGPDAPDLDKWGVRTNLSTGTTGDPTPAAFGPAAQVERAVVCQGASIEGTVEESIIAPGAHVEAGAVVRRSIIGNDCRIGAGAVIDGAILDKRVTVGRDARVGVGEAAPNPEHAATLASGVTVVGKATRLPAECVIGRSCVIAPDLDEFHFRRGPIASGSTVKP